MRLGLPLIFVISDEAVRPTIKGTDYQGR